jgi:guanine deaminase
VTGKEADFIVLDLEVTPLLQRRTRAAPTIREKLFAAMTLGDDRCVEQVHILGRQRVARRGAGISESVELSG